GVDVEVRNSFGRDAMQIAARNGTVGVMKILHQNGGQLTSRGGPRSSTLFHLAAENGHIAVMQWMNSVGGISHGCDLYGQTAVHVAARRGELETIHYLHFSLDLDLAAEDFDGLTPL
ncbi:ankyrin repeat-containing domain protein, partial [Ochromonadaceae sp. CCMP2298]